MCFVVYVSRVINHALHPCLKKLTLLKPRENEEVLRVTQRQCHVFTNCHFHDDDNRSRTFGIIYLLFILKQTCNK